MPKITSAGVSDMDADRAEARRTLARDGVADPTQEQLDDALQTIVDRRSASAHLEQGAEVSVTPEHQAAKLAGGHKPAAGPDGGEQLGDDGQQDAAVPGVEYDPGDHTVAEVLAHLDGLPDDDDGDAERDRILDAERAGKGRTTITG